MPLTYNIHNIHIIYIDAPSYVDPNAPTEHHSYHVWSLHVHVVQIDIL